jgi:hypothetical protein
MVTEEMPNYHFGRDPGTRYLYEHTSKSNRQTCVTNGPHEYNTFTFCYYSKSVKRTTELSYQTSTLKKGEFF